MKDKLNALEYAEVFKALGHPIRLKMACGLVKNESCNVNAIVQKFSLPQPTVSQHLNILKKAGIIEGCRKGVEVCYKVINPKVIKLIKCLDTDLCSNDKA